MRVPRFPIQPFKGHGLELWVPPLAHRLLVDVVHLTDERVVRFLLLVVAALAIVEGEVDL